MSHIHEKIDFCVEAFIVHDNKVLLRMHDKYHIWLAIGGHIELEEDPIEALFREVKEESGLPIILVGWDVPSITKDVKHLMPPTFLNRHFAHAPHEHIALGYVATTDQSEVHPQPGEEAECKWFSLEELSDPQYAINPNVQYFARNALQIVGKIKSA